MKLINKQLGFTVAIILGIIMVFLPGSDKSKFNFNPETLSSIILSNEDQISPETLSEWVVEERKDYLLIDIRSEKEFNEGNIKTSENIPLKDLLSKNTLDDLSQDQKTIILYSNGSSHASQAWLVLSSAGLDSYILEGGMNYWNKNILNPAPPSGEVSDDEILIYRTKAAVAGFLGGGSGVASGTSSTPVVKKKFKKRPKKKKKKLEGC
ncbi:MAG: rhodanese-like domain-containing protein [Acidobacteriota bacterium]